MPVHNGETDGTTHSVSAASGIGGAFPEARTKVQAQKAETKIRQEVMTVDMVDRLVRHPSRSL